MNTNTLPNVISTCLTIPEIVKELDISSIIPKTTVKEAKENLKYQMLHTRDLKVDSEYQRLISLSGLSKYGKLNRNLLATTIVSKRPKSCGAAGLYVIDGQHKAIMLDTSGLQDDDNAETWLPCQVKEWPEGMSLNEIKLGEAEIYLLNNTYRKEPTTVDKYSCASFMGLNTFQDQRTDYQKEAILVLETMRILNLAIDNFGSDKVGVMPLVTPGPFFSCVKDEYRNKNITSPFTSPLEKLRNALDLYKTVYPKRKDNKIHGTIFRTMFICSDFMLTGLTNGAQKCFNEYLTDTKIGLARDFSEDELKRNQGQAAGYRYILHERVIDKYNKWRENTPDRTDNRITDMVLTNAVSKNPEFANPNIIIV